MNTQICPNCQNLVVGEFTPTSTRKWLTTLAKKGGMKAVLTAAGSVIPGFGNAAGFIAGAAIDVFYGKDIDKLIDEIADLFEENKLYVFTCPKCGHTWTSNEISDCDAEKTSSLVDLITGSENRLDLNSENDSSDEAEIENNKFNYVFHDYLKNIDAIIENENDTTLYNEIDVLKEFADETDTPVIKSQYYYLIALGGLLYCKEHFESYSGTSLLRLSKEYIAKAFEILEDDEYLIVAQSIDSLITNTAKECVDLGILDYEKLEFEHNLFKPEFLQSIYEECRFLTIDTIAKGSQDEQINEQLWLIASQLSDEKYKMYALVELFWIYIDDEDDDDSESDMLSDRCADCLIRAYESPDFSIDKINVNDFFDKQWLVAYESYAYDMIDGSMPQVKQDVERGLSMLQKIIELEPCFAKELAYADLGGLLEEGKYLEQDLEKALYYFTECNDEEAIARVNGKLKQNQADVFSPADTEYIEEVKACYDEDGKISNASRRLLNKLGVKLGISEQRAAVLEQQVLNEFSLTAAEREYLDEYKECYRDGSSISNGERRLLNRLRDKLGITEERCSELESMI